MNTLYDDELIYLYRQGNELAFEALENKYRLIISKCVWQLKKYLKDTGFDEDECIQECLLCFYQCIDYYCETKDAKFSTYFGQRMQYTILNYKKRLFVKNQNELAYEGVGTREWQILQIPFQRFDADPKRMLEYSKTMKSVAFLKEESRGLERQVLECLLRGESSREMGKHLAIEQRQINNALYRIRKKIRIVQQKFD